MAVDLMGERLALREAAAAGLRSLELLASSLSPRAAAPVGEIADQAVARFRRAINLLDRTGHARFRRAPVGVAPAETDSPPASPSRPRAPVLPAPKSQNDLVALDFEKPAPAAATSTSFLSSVTAAGGGEGSVSKGQSLLAGVSSGKPPLPKRKHPCPGAVAPSPAAEATTAARPATCHCSGKRRRKHLTTRTVRVPASSRASTDVPSDEHSWRKYGQKPIKGSPFPRGYYRCSAVKGCPARKHVERDASDPATLVVTYEGDHRHDSAAAAAAAAPQAVASVHRGRVRGLAVVAVEEDQY